MLYVDLIHTDLWIVCYPTPTNYVRALLGVIRLSHPPKLLIPPVLTW